MKEIWCPHMPGEVIAVDGDGDPNAYWPGTEWTRVAQGRALVGVGTGTDANGTEREFAAGDNPGEYAHGSTVEETASHNHGDLYWRIEGDRTQIISLHGVDMDKAYNIPFTYGTSNAGADDVRIVTGKAGGGKPHNNVQPTYGVAYWRRDK